jgi:hypothetical protein
MALYLEVERPDGSVEKLPVNNHETVEVGGEVESVTPLEEPITSRDSLDERRYTRFRDIRRVIQHAELGDVLLFSTLGESYSKKEMEVQESKGDMLLGRTRTGSEYRAVRRWYGQMNRGDGEPWLRTGDGESYGEIEWVEIVNLSEVDE